MLFWSSKFFDVIIIKFNTLLPRQCLRLYPHVHYFFFINTSILSQLGLSDLSFLVKEVPLYLFHFKLSCLILSNLISSCPLHLYFLFSRLENMMKLVYARVSLLTMLSQRVM